jgi:hypothetical protein
MGGAMAARRPQLPSCTQGAAARLPVKEGRLSCRTASRTVSGSARFVTDLRQAGRHL